MNYLMTEELHNFRRVGVTVNMGPLWEELKSPTISLVPDTTARSQEPLPPRTKSAGAA
jgi:hypothetical protein